MRLDIPSQIGLVHPVDLYKQYVFDLVEVVTPNHRRGRQHQNAGSCAAEHGSCKPERRDADSESAEKSSWVLGIEGICRDALKGLDHPGGSRRNRHDVLRTLPGRTPVGEGSNRYAPQSVVSGR
jgi:hypothetical protein